MLCVYRVCARCLLICLPCVQIGNRVLYMFFTHVRELFGDVALKPVVRPLRWSNMATMPALPETQESVKEEIRRQVSSGSLQPNGSNIFVVPSNPKMYISASSNKLDSN